MQRTVDGIAAVKIAYVVEVTKNLLTDRVLVFGLRVRDPLQEVSQFVDTFCVRGRKSDRFIFRIPT